MYLPYLPTTTTTLPTTTALLLLLLRSSSSSYACGAQDAGQSPARALARAACKEAASVAESKPLCPPNSRSFPAPRPPSHKVRAHLARISQPHGGKCCAVRWCPKTNRAFSSLSFSRPLASLFPRRRDRRHSCPSRHAPRPLARWSAAETGARSLSLSLSLSLSRAARHAAPPHTNMLPRRPLPGGRPSRAGHNTTSAA